MVDSPFACLKMKSEMIFFNFDLWCRSYCGLINNNNNDDWRLADQPLLFFAHNWQWATTIGTSTDEKYFSMGLSRSWVLMCL